MSFDMVADHRKFFLPPREPDLLASVVSLLKHLLQRQSSVDYGPNMHLCLMLAFGITDASISGGQPIRSTARDHVVRREQPHIERRDAP